MAGGSRCSQRPDHIVKPLYGEITAAVINAAVSIDLNIQKPRSYPGLTALAIGSVPPKLKTIGPPYLDRL